MSAIIRKLWANKMFVNLLSAITYVLVFRLVYEQYLYPVWGYMGYYYYVHSSFVELLTNILAIAPIFYYQARKIPSDFIAIFIYIFIVAPSVLSIEYGFQDYKSVVVYQIVYSIAMAVLFRIKTPQHIIHQKNENKISFRVYFTVITVILVSVIAAFHSNMRLVSFAEVYNLREETAEVNVNPLIGYFMMWLANFFTPLFVSYGLYKKKKKIVALGFACALIVYMASALKSAITMPIFCVLIFYVLRCRQGDIYNILPGVVTVFIVMYVVGIAADNYLTFIILSLFIQRTFGISALLTPGYITVFDTVPHTYFSHVRIINTLTGMYPFKEPVMGKAVWAEFTGKDDVMNANANMLLTDGVASLGVVGVIIAAFLFALILRYLNKISSRHDGNFVLTLLTGIIMSLSNVSMFTVLLSCGLLLILLLLRFTIIDENLHK